MFKKPYIIDSFSSIRSSDLRKLKNIILTLYNIDNNNLLNIIPLKSNIIKQKINNNINLITISELDDLKVNIPIFIDINNKIIPTLYTIWKCPTILPVLYVRLAVFEFIMQGADIMLPGCLSNSSIFNEENCRVGSLVVIVADTNPFAIGIGELLIDYNTYKSSNNKGKCVKVLHYFSDQLKATPMIVPNEYFKLTPTPEILPLPKNYFDNNLVASTEKLIINDDDDKKDNDFVQNNETINTSTDFEESKAELIVPLPELDVPDLTNISVDDLFLFGAKTALSALENSKLPVEYSAFNILLKNSLSLYTSRHAEIKLTSFKKFGNFMDHLVTLNWITFKSMKGNLYITSIDRSHNDLRQKYKAPIINAFGNSTQSEIAKDDPDAKYGIVYDEHDSSTNSQKYEMDQLAKSWLLLAFKFEITDDLLPINVSALYSEYMLLFKSDLDEFDWKRTSYGKLSKFVDTLCKSRLLKCKEVDNTNTVLKIDRTHPDFAWFKPTAEDVANHKKNIKLREASMLKSDDSFLIGSPIEIFESCKLPANFASLLDFDCNEFIAIKDAKKLFTDYIAANNLTHIENKSMVVLNDQLLSCFNTKAKVLFSSEFRVVSKAELLQSFVSKLFFFYSIRPEGDDSALKYFKGDITPIRVVMEYRKNKKVVTLITHLETFHIDPNELAKVAAKKYSASTSCSDCPSGIEVLIQGNVGRELVDAMHDHYKIPLKYFVVNDKT